MLNENKGDEMIEILKHLHQYVPEEETEEEVYISSEQRCVKKHTVHQHIVIWRRPINCCPNKRSPDCHVQCNELSHEIGRFHSYYTGLAHTSGAH